MRQKSKFENLYLNIWCAWNLCLTWCCTSKKCLIIEKKGLKFSPVCQNKKKILHWRNSPQENTVILFLFSVFFYDYLYCPYIDFCGVCNHGKWKIKDCLLLMPSAAFLLTLILRVLYFRVSGYEKPTAQLTVIQNAKSTKENCP